MPPKVKISPVVDPFQFLPANGKLILDVEGSARIVSQFARPMLMKTQLVLADAVVEVPLDADLFPLLEPLHVRAGLHEKLHFHLLKLAGAKNEIPRRDLVAEGLSDLSDP